MREDGRLSTDQKTVSWKNRWRPTDATYAAAHTCARSFRADASHTEIHSSTHGSGPQAVLTRLPGTWACSPLAVGSGKSRSGLGTDMHTHTSRLTQTRAAVVSSATCVTVATASVWRFFLFFSFSSSSHRHLALCLLLLLLLLYPLLLLMIPSFRCPFLLWLFRSAPIRPWTSRPPLCLRYHLACLRLTPWLSFTRIPNSFLSTCRLPFLHANLYPLLLLRPLPNPPRILLLVIALLFLSHLLSSFFLVPSLCRSRPSSHSLPSLLLCPHSLSDHALSSVETLDDVPSMEAMPRPRTLLRQQSLQQPLIQAPAPNLASRPPISQSLGQLHTQPGSGGGGGAGPGGGGGAGSRSSRGSPAGAGGRASHGNPGSVDHMMGQITRRGLDVKSFL